MDIITKGKIKQVNKKIYIVNNWFTKMFVDEEYEYSSISDLFDEIAGIYKYLNQNDEAIKYYEKSYEYSKKNNDRNKMIVTLNNICKILSQDLIKLVDLYEKIIDLCLQIDDNYKMAKYGELLVDLYEKHYDYENAICVSERIIERISNDTSCELKKRKFILKLGNLYSLVENYNKAIYYFELIASDEANKYYSYSLFLKAGICRLYNDVDDLGITLDRYVQSCIKFQNSIQYKLLSDIYKTCVDKDLSTFQTILNDYDTCYSLDEWMISMFLKIKKKVFEDIGDIEGIEL